MSQRVRSNFPADIERVASKWILRRDAGMGVGEQAEFERWQAEDARHASAVARKDEAWAALGRPLDCGQADLLLQRLASHAASRRRRRTGVATTALALLFFTGVVWQSRQAVVPVSRENRGVVLRPETRTLPDGSVWELKFGTEVEMEFSERVRRVILKKGEAHFQVVTDKGRPFVVMAGNVEVRAVGTAFSVELGSSQVEVLVTEGRVAVEQSVAGASVPGSDLGANAAEKIAETVDAGNRIVVELRSQSPAAAPVATAVTPNQMAQRLAWRVPRLEFSDVPLSDAIELLNRHNEVQFRVDDVAVARLRVSGIFRADNIDTFVRLLDATCGVTADRSGATIVLRKSAP